MDPRTHYLASTRGARAKIRPPASMVVSSPVGGGHNMTALAQAQALRKHKQAGARGSAKALVSESDWRDMSAEEKHALQTKTDRQTDRQKHAGGRR